MESEKLAASRKVEPRRQGRERLVRRIERRLEPLMVGLGLVWLALLVIELLAGESRWVTIASDVIWAVFVADFAFRLAISPRRGAFLRRNVITAASLALPALRVFRAARALRALRATRVIRSLRFARVITRLNRGLRALRSMLARRQFVYVSVATVVVTIIGATGMYALERDAGTFDSFSEALWWTAMIMTTMGSERWPATPEGRVLCVLLATYSFAIFGYITATLAKFLIGKDHDTNDLSGAREELAALRRDVAALRAELNARADDDVR